MKLTSTTQTSVIIIETVLTPMAQKAVVLPPPKAYDDPLNPSAQGRMIIEAAQDPSIKHGDAQKTVKKIFELSLLENPPFRLFLGQDTLAVIPPYVNQVLAELREYGSWSEDLKED